MATDVLLDTREMKKNSENSVWHKCKLGRKWLFSTSRIIRYSHFENEVMKIQRGEYKSLSDNEKRLQRGAERLQRKKPSR